MTTLLAYPIPRAVVQLRPSLRGYHQDPRRLIAATRALARRLAAAGDHSTLEILYADSGKPYLRGSPLHFSLSHSSGVTALAVAQVPIGIDIEFANAISPTEVQRLETVASSPAETATWPDDMRARRDALIRSWSWKEAATKSTGEGFAGYDPCELSAMFAHNSVTSKTEPRRWWVADIPHLPVGLIGAIAAESPLDVTVLPSVSASAT